MIKIKKRDKRSRLRGRKTCGYGSRKKHRGKGSKGGKGMAGTGKRAGHKRTFLFNYMPDYFGKHGFKSQKQIKNLKPKIIKIGEIEKKLDKFLKDGIAKKTSEGIEIDLQGYKILNDGGELKKGLIIKNAKMSKSVKEKLKAEEK